MIVTELCHWISSDITMLSTVPVLKLPKIWTSQRMGRLFLYCWPSKIKWNGGNVWWKVTLKLIHKRWNPSLASYPIWILRLAKLWKKWWYYFISLQYCNPAICFNFSLSFIFSFSYMCSYLFLSSWCGLRLIS